MSDPNDPPNDPETTFVERYRDELAKQPTVLPRDREMARQVVEFFCGYLHRKLGVVNVREMQESPTLRAAVEDMLAAGYAPHSGSPGLTQENTRDLKNILRCVGEMPRPTGMSEETHASALRLLGVLKSYTAAPHSGSAERALREALAKYDDDVNHCRDFGTAATVFIHRVRAALAAAPPDGTPGEPARDEVMIVPTPKAEFALKAAGMWDEATMGASPPTVPVEPAVTVRREEACSICGWRKAADTGGRCSVCRYTSTSTRAATTAASPIPPRAPVERDDESWRCGGCVDRGPCEPPTSGRPRICALDATAREHHLKWNGSEWVDDRCGCRYHPDDDNGSHEGAPHVHTCKRHTPKRSRYEGALEALRSLRKQDGSLVDYRVEDAIALLDGLHLEEAIASLEELAKPGP